MDLSWVDAAKVSVAAIVPLAVVLWALIEWRARKVFATREDVDAMGGKITGAVSMSSMAKDTADQNSDRLIRLEESEKHRWEPVLKFMERTDKRMDRHENALTRVSALLDEITRRMDRDENRSRATP